MNCASESRVRIAPARRGFSLLEMLLAVAIAMSFLSGVYAIFMKTLQAYQRVEARAGAVRNARTAVTSLTDEIRQISRLGADVLLIGQNNTLAFGDGIDNDGDGTVDDEEFDGKDDDNGAGGVAANVDQHAQLGAHKERPSKVGKIDFGDRDVDEDVKFGRDFLTFRIYPTNPTPTMQYKTVTYAVTTFDGQDNVLVRQTRIQYANGTSALGIAPIAFGVLGFDVLYWDPNAPPADQDWVTTWDSTRAVDFAPPNLPLPASILVRITVDANPSKVPVADGAPRETYVAQTMLDIEQTINDALFPRPILL